ncbi:MAG: squalene/phytoene synthase family protein [Candidatus Beckwithbacteria bacterium]|nr:squalene/phytoene synthase family protein [Candidatus Beckwithbacteria bacterium]
MNPSESLELVDSQAYASPAYQRPDSKLWLFCIKLSEHLFPKKGELIVGINSIMRNLDDIADGDREPPKGFTAISYLQKKREFCQNPDNPEDDVDRYIRHCSDCAQGLGFDIQEELDDFFTYFMFDATRLNTGQVFSKVDLDQAYNACSRGTINGLIKVFGLAPDKFDVLAKMGKAVRIYYTLRDFEIDMAKGFVNIPLEEMEQYQIDQKDLSDRHSPGIRQWFQAQATLGMDWLKQHHEEVKKGNVPFLVQMIVPLMYERSARPYFEAVLADKK